MRGLTGVAVTVLVPASSSVDAFGSPVPGPPDEVAVENVLVDSPSGSDVESTTREFGVSCDLTLHFPKTCLMSLRGCSVALPAPWSGTFEVMGDPQPYDPRLTPGAHDRPVRVRRVAG